MGFWSDTYDRLAGYGQRLAELVSISPTPKVTIRSLQDAVDARVDLFISAQIAPAQALYSGTRDGKYWQGIVTTVNPSLPNNRDADALPLEVVPTRTGKPTDQAESWVDVGIALAATVPTGLQVDTYDGPGGKGYTVTSRVRHTGVIYSRVRNFGPETYREQGWQVEAAE